MAALVVDHFAAFERLAIERGTRGAGRPHAKGQPTQSMAMTAFLKRAELIQTSVRTVESAVTKISRLRIDSLHASTSERQAQVAKELDAAIAETDSAVGTAKGELADLQAETSRMKAQKTAPATEVRMRENMVGSLATRLKGSIEKLHRVQSQLADETRENTERQLQMVMPDKTPEEVKQLAREGVTTQEVVEQRLAGIHPSVVMALHGIQDRYRDVRRLEGQMADLHRMFVEMAQLVEFQGEMLNSIEGHVKHTRKNMRQAEGELVYARKAQSKAQQRTCCLTVFLLIIVMIIVFPALS